MLISTFRGGCSSVRKPPGFSPPITAYHSSFFFFLADSPRPIPFPSTSYPPAHPPHLFPFPPSLFLKYVQFPLRPPQRDRIAYLPWVQGFCNAVTTPFFCLFFSSFYASLPKPPRKGFSMLLCIVRQTYSVLPLRTLFEKPQFLIPELFPDTGPNPRFERSRIGCLAFLHSFTYDISFSSGRSECLAWHIAYSMVG